MILADLMMMAANKKIQLIGFSGVTGDPVDVPISVPAGTGINDLLFISSASGDNRLSNLLSGFTATGESTERHRHKIQRRVRLSGDGSSYSAIMSGYPNTFAISAVTYRNAAVDVVGTLAAVSGGGGMAAPGVTVGFDNSVLLLHVGVYRVKGIPSVIGTPAGFTLLGRVGAAGTNDPEVAVFHKLVNAGATGDVTISAAAVDYTSAQLVSLKLL